MLTIKWNNGIEMPMLGFGTFKNGGEDGERSVCEAIKIEMAMTW